MTGTKTCPFCQPGEAVLQNGLAFAVNDKFPVAPGHMLLIPRRHVADWFETSEEERRDLLALADDAPTLHLYVIDGGARCNHRLWRDPGHEEWLDAVSPAGPAPRRP